MLCYVLLYYIMLYYIIVLYYIIWYIFMQGATGVPGESVANKDTPGTRENVPVPVCSGPGRQPLSWGP